ncbi:MAG: lysylphosphatidylglycerol synthase domain-containing protein [Opitutaceae bacterium]
MNPPENQFSTTQQATEPETSPARTEKPWHRVLTWVGRIVSMVCIGFLLFTVYRYKQELPPVRSDGGSILVGTAVVIFGLISVGINALAWQRIVRRLHPVSWKQAFSITGRSQIAKYLPGNVFHYLGKMILARREGLTTPVILISILVETVLAVGTGAAIGLAGFGLAAPEYRTLSIVVLIGLLLSPLAWRLLKPRIRVIHEAIDRVGIPHLSQAVFCNGVNFLLFGTSAFLLAQNLWAEPLALGWWELTWGCALAWIVGFVTPGAPGGVGVREGILVALFSGQIGYPSAAALFLALRMAQVASDGVAFLLAAIVERNRHSS